MKIPTNLSEKAREGLMEMASKMQEIQDKKAFLWWVPNIVEGNNQLDALISSLLYKLAFVFGGNRSGKSYSGGVLLLINALGWSPAFLVWFEDTIRKMASPSDIEIPVRFRIKGNLSFVPWTPMINEFWQACKKETRRFFVDKDHRKGGRKLCWIISKDSNQQIDAAQAVLEKYLPDDEIAVNTRGERRVMQTRGCWVRVFLKNGSKIELKTYEQGREHFQGPSVHFFWSDEECPELVWNEVLVRTAQVKGHGCVTMTPLKGLTFMYDRYYEPWEKGEGKYPVFFLDSTKNPHLDPADIEEMVAGMSPEEKEARLTGKFVALTGLVFPGFKREVHGYEVLPKELGKYIWFRGGDFGADHPTAISWIGYDPITKEWWIENEYVGSGSFLSHATSIQKAPEEEFVRIGYMDPSQKQAITEFKTFNIHFMKAVNDRAAGIALIRGLFEEERLHINLRKCPVLVYELEHHRHRPPSRLGEHIDASVVKKDDDVIDSVRYVIASRPESSGGDHIRLTTRYTQGAEKRRFIHPITKRPMRRLNENMSKCPECGAKFYSNAKGSTECPECGDKFTFISNSSS